MAKLKGSNPADAFRKAQRARELKKNKEGRKAARESQTVKRDTRDLEDEIRRLKALPKLSEGHKARLNEVEAELAYVIKTKEAYVKLHPEAKDRVFKVHAPRSGPSGSGAGGEEENAMSHLYDDQGRLRDPTKSVYYHELYNPFGVPPPGMPYRERTPPPEPDSDDDEEDDEEDSDDEIILPAGPAPGVDEEDSGDESDDIPLPPGPPPPRTLPSAMPPQRPPIYMTGPSTMPPGGMQANLPFAPPLHGHSGSGPSRPRQPRGAPSVQDPLSDAPTQTYQGYRAGKADLPARPAAESSPTAGAVSAEGANLPPRPVPPPRKPMEEGAGTISAEPQLRDLRKEATAFVPRGVKRKSGAGAGGGGAGGGKNGVAPRINAAPGAGTVDEDGDEIKYPSVGGAGSGSGLLGVLKGVLSDQSKPQAKKAEEGTLDDDYQKFLAGLEEIA